MAKAIVSTVRPNASETPTSPIPKLESVPPNAAASTALPQPPNVNQKVPKTSAASFFVMGYPLFLPLPWDAIVSEFPVSEANL
jgi:hypothetical protein